MREPPSERGLPALAWLISAIVAAYIIELFTSSVWLHGDPDITNRLAVTISGIKELRFWTVGTYSLLHSTDNLLHIVGVVVGLLLLGRELVPVIGSARFLGVYFSSIALGALVWTAVNWQHGGMLIGGAAGVYGLIALYACLYPNLELNFLLFFVFPVTLKPKHLAWGLALADFLACAYYEVLGAKAPFVYAASAHIGGLTAGWLYYRFFYATTSSIATTDSGEATALAWANRKSVSSASPTTAHPTRREELRIEVDRILDKINSTGLSSLTAAEKRLLDEAKALLTKG
jgi:membrane associated rhomboid family serine protease